MDYRHKSSEITQLIRELNSDRVDYRAILELGKLSVASLGIREYQREMGKLVRRMVACEQVFLFRYDETKKQFFRKCPLKDGRQWQRYDYKSTNKNYVGACAVEQNPIEVRAFKNDLRARKFDPSIVELVKNSAWLFPIVNKGETIGVLMIADSLRENGFSHDDFEVMELITGQLAVALENYDLVEKLRNQFQQTVLAMTDAIGKKDTYTGGHTKRVAHFAEMIGRELELAYQDMEDLRLAAVLHDVGKIGIEDAILKKKSPLTDEEFVIMRNHPAIGYEILGHITSFGQVIDGMRFHHERPDGKGYPYGLKGDEIPLIASIISVADTFDAMISTRPYRKGLPPMVAWQEIIDYSGTQFDHRVVAAFDSWFKKTKMYRPHTVGEKRKAG